MRRMHVYRPKIMAALALAVITAGLATVNAPYTIQPTNANQNAQGAAAFSRHFPETGYVVRGKFLQYWLAYGGLPQHGFPISGEMTELSDIDRKPYTVQYFERAVFEYHPENQPPYDVLLSHLGVVRYGQKYPGPKGGPGQEPNSTRGSIRFPETGKRLGDEFLTYWRSHGGLMQQGLPISDEFVERSELDGKEYTVQYFERAVFELHPEYRPPYNVLLSQLGTVRYRARYRGANARPILPPTVPVPSTEWEQAKVVRVVDGDTIEVVSNGRPLTVRYLLIDAAESSDPSTAECYRREATAANQAMVGGKTVYLEKDASDTDASGNLLRYVFTVDSLVNADLARGGFARMANAGANMRYQALLNNVEREARDTKRGLWGAICVKAPTRRELFEKPPPTKTPTTTPTPTPTKTATPTSTPQPTATQFEIPIDPPTPIADRSENGPTLPDPRGCASPDDTSCSTPVPGFSPDAALPPTSTPTFSATPTLVLSITAGSTPEATSTPAITLTPEIEATPEATAVPKATSTPEATAVSKATSTPETKATPEPTSTPKTEATLEATSTPEITATPETEATPEPTSTPETGGTPEPTAVSKATSTPEATAVSKATSTPETKATPEATPMPETKTTPSPQP